MRTLKTARIRIQTDPRIELLSVVQWLSDYRGPDGERILTRLDFPYLTTIQRRFGNCSEHPVVVRFGEMSRRGFWYGQPPHVMLFLSDPPDLTIRRPIDAFVLERAGGQESLEEFVVLLRRFSADTDFTEFYRSQRSFYQAMMERYQQMVSGFHYVEDLEAYYGHSQASYTIILAPLYHPGGFGLRVGRAPGSYDVYNVSGPYDVGPDGVPTFGDAAELRRIVWHEFGHSFVNYLVDDQLRLFLEPCSVLSANMRERVEAAPNVTWEMFIHEWVSEHIVRAVTTRLAYRELGETAGKAALEKEHSQGYPYVGELTAALQRYEHSREEYPNLSSFLPELARVFDDVARRR